MGREVGGGSAWGTHVHPWQIHVNVWQNQYNIEKFKKKKKRKVRIWENWKLLSIANVPFLETYICILEIFSNIW